MNSAKTWLIVVLALAAIGSGWIAWTQRAELAALRAAALPREERAALQKRVWDLEKANRELKQQLTSHRESRSEGQELATSSRNMRAENETALRALTGQQVLSMNDPDLLKNPEMQALLSQQTRSLVESRYAALFSSLKLPPDQIDKLKALLTDRYTTVADVFTVAANQGLDVRDNVTALVKIMTDARNEADASMRSFLGEAGFTQLSLYERTLPQRGAVGELQQRLSYTATPLTSNQADQLIQILAANPAPGGKPSAPERTGVLDQALVSALGSSTGSAFFSGATSIITPEAISQSQGILSPPQIAALQQMQQQQQAQQQLRQIRSNTKK